MLVCPMMIIYPEDDLVKDLGRNADAVALDNQFKFFKFQVQIITLLSNNWCTREQMGD